MKFQIILAAMLLSIGFSCTTEIKNAGLTAIESKFGCEVSDSTGSTTIDGDTIDYYEVQANFDAELTDTEFINFRSQAALIMYKSMSQSELKGLTHLKVTTVDKNSNGKKDEHYTTLETLEALVAHEGRTQDIVDFYNASDFDSIKALFVEESITDDQWAKMDVLFARLEVAIGKIQSIELDRTLIATDTREGETQNLVGYRYNVYGEKGLPGNFVTIFSSDPNDGRLFGFELHGF